MNELFTYLNQLSPLRKETRKQIEPVFSEKTLQKGDYFIREHEKARQIGFLQKGIIRAFYRTAQGQEYNKHFFTPGSFAGGYSSLVTGAPNQINQQALTDCELWVADYTAITALYDRFPDFERAGRRLAELYFVHKEERELEIVMLNADERYKIFRNQYPGLEQIIPQYHIASYLGITATQLSRIRRKFSAR